MRYLTTLNDKREWGAEREHYGVNGGKNGELQQTITALMREFEAIRCRRAIRRDYRRELKSAPWEKAA